jgi:CheY-like chemotaxis protein
VDIGIEPYKIAAALRGVIAQRLMRRLCPACRDVRAEPLPDRLAAWVPAGAPLRKAVGCPECAMTGYRGRFSIVEVLTVTPDVERAIGAGATADRIAEAGRAGGMRGLWESGLARVLDGETSLEELLRIVDVPAGSAPAARRADVRPSGPAAGAPPSVALPAADDPFELLEDFAPAAVTRAGRKVLLVDDEDALRGVLRDLLVREGYSVSEARDGIQALDQVDRVGPDIIVLDLVLPGIDGYGVLSHLRSRPSTAAIPVVVLTARGDEDNEVRVFQSGANDFLSKPFRPRALAARLDAVLARASSAP